MNLDPFKQAWQSQQSQPRLTIDAELLLKEVQRNQRTFAAVIFWRDVREVGIALTMVPFWIFMGVKLHLPWTWFLMVPSLLWVAGFMLVDRMRHKPQPHEPAESLRRCVECSQAQIEHQIWLLSNIFWWYLLPFTGPMLAFFCDVAWRKRDGGWWTILTTTIVISICVVVFACICRLNQHAVRDELEPRRRELKELEVILLSLQDETSIVG